VGRVGAGRLEEVGGCVERGAMGGEENNRGIGVGKKEGKEEGKNWGTEKKEGKSRKEGRMCDIVSAVG